MIDVSKNKKIILFDGVCNLCNNAVLKVIRYDKDKVFIFAALQSKSGFKILNHLGIETNTIDTLILYEPGTSYDVKSTAVIKIINSFGGLWKLTQLLWVFPVGFRDFVYDFIAKNRYKWFVKKESCSIQAQELKMRFLD
ncbi:thiol-disulfide oxidoreductase DCC family protein [Polaribacter sp.]|nr:thiol-disulfide oxidoreductase DCC family protein [Polaribacter sp.]